jgi:hypothetical protein
MVDALQHITLDCLQNIAAVGAPVRFRCGFICCCSAYIDAGLTVLCFLIISCRWFFQQLILAVDYCHRKGVANRDIKLENTLLQVGAGFWAA